MTKVIVHYEKKWGGDQEVVNMLSEVGEFRPERARLEKTLGKGMPGRGSPTSKTWGLTCSWRQQGT